MRPSLGTRRPGRAVEQRWWKKGSGAEDSGEADSVRCRRSIPRGRANEGEQDAATTEPSMLMSSGARGSAMGAVTEWGGVRIGLTLPPHRQPPPFIPYRQNPSYRGLHQPLGPPAGPIWPQLRALVGLAEFSSRPNFLQGNRPLLLFYIFFFSLQFKFSLNLNSNLVSIPVNLYNPVEIFCNIVMINFMFRLW
jgi:hypothetical protein